MKIAEPLPAYLVKRYRGWKATGYEENKAWYKHLAELGQHPRAMVISCCDSRVHVTALFGADQGEFFIHRNIANLVPVYNPKRDTPGTAATIEYAVTVLRVAHILVLGHSNCGGVQGCLDMCVSKEKSVDDTSFVAKWLQILSPAYPKVSKIKDKGEQRTEFEHMAVRTSINNLMTYPFVKSAVASNLLSLHGLWYDIGKGEIMVLDGGSGRFVDP